MYQSPSTIFKCMYFYAFKWKIYGNAIAFCRNARFETCHAQNLLQTDMIVEDTGYDACAAHMYGDTFSLKS